MNALEAASLVMIPSGYEDGTLGSLKPIDGSGDFTFSRGSNLSATRVKEDGYIEKGYENLLLQSNQFDTTWTTSGTSVTSGQSGYDGSNDAWLLTNNNASFPRIESSATLSGVSTYSVYAKAGTNSFCQLRIFGNLNTDVWFDLSTGLSIYSTGSGLIDINSENIGNGWYRLSLIVNVNVTGVRIYSAESFPIYGLGSIYIQDAQINQGLVALPYVESGATNGLGGLLENEPRIDFTGGGCGSLLLEPSRTNLVYQSEYYGVYAPTRVTLTSNYGISPDGNQNAAAIFNTTELGRHNLNGEYFSVTSGTSYVNSVFAKAGTITKMQLRMFSGGGTSIGFNDGVFDLTNGTATGTGAGIESYGNGWYRCYVIDSPTSSVSNARFNIELLDANGGISYPGSITDYIEVFGSDVTESTYPTSYIPTYGVSQTRAGEDVELPSLSSVFDSTGDYTILFEVERLSDVNESQFIYLRSSIFNYITLNATSLGICEIVLYDGTSGATATTPSNSFIPNSSIKIAVRISGNTCSSFFNGSELTFNNTNVTPRNFDRYQNNRNHRKYQEVYISTALSDSECIALTTI